MLPCVGRFGRGRLWAGLAGYSTARKLIMRAVEPVALKIRRQAPSPYQFTHNTKERTARTLIELWSGGPV